MASTGSSAGDLLALEEYVEKLFSLTNREAETLLWEKYSKLRRKDEVRRRGKGVSTARAFISPCSVSLLTGSGVPMPVLSVCNPAAALQEKVLRLYLRVCTSRFDRSFVAVTEVRAEGLEGRLQVDARPLICGVLPYESVEDPRVDPDAAHKVYHARALYGPDETRVFTFEYDVELGRVRAISFESSRWGEFLLSDYRDTFPLSGETMVVRPFFREKSTGFIVLDPRRETIVEFDEAVIPPELAPGKGEVKTGGNVSLKLSSNEYLLLYHAVDSHGAYFIYAALMDAQGNLLALARDPLIAPEPELYSRRRPSTVFPCGAVKLDDSILIAAGVDDEIAAIYEVREDVLWELLKPV